MNVAAVSQLMGYQVLSSCRSFASVFYTIVLPLVLFVVFGTTFGVDADYAVFFLPGMIAVMTSSDALFAVGPVMKEFFRQGIVREFRNYPINIAWLFCTFIATRLLFVLTSSVLLAALSGILFGYVPDPGTALRYLVAVVLGFTTYGLIALCISFMGIVDNKDQGMLSIYYFLGMFLSDAYLSLSQKNWVLDAVGYFFPLKPMLQLMRGNDMAAIPLLAWLAGAVTLFMLVVRSMRVART